MKVGSFKFNPQVENVNEFLFKLLFLLIRKQWDD